MGNFSVLCACNFYPLQKSLALNGITPHCMEKKFNKYDGESRVAFVNDFKAVLPLRRRDCDSIKNNSLYSRLLVEPSVRNGASPTSATTMR
jgi:hypothetical protein